MRKLPPTRGYVRPSFSNFLPVRQITFAAACAGCAIVLTSCASSDADVAAFRATNDAAYASSVHASSAAAAPTVESPSAPASSASTQTAPTSGTTTAATQSVLPTASKPTSDSVLKLMMSVADWQLAHPSLDPKDGWIYGAFYTGVMALARTASDPKYADAMMKQAQANGWKPGSRIYHADDHVVTQMYLELYEINQDPSMYLPTRQRFDLIYEYPKDTDLDFSKNGATDKWSWCDALFMDPPAWARLSKVTGEDKYLASANQRWWVTSDFLYDKDEHLYYRDSRYFTRLEPNEKKLFWSRGNGWVLAGLARMIDYLPKDYPDMPKYLRQFRQMAEKIKTLQQPDGTWHAGLLDPVAHPEKETSGTGFFTFALAWGINKGILDRAEYEPVVFKAWNALAQSVQPDGKLVNVQPVGDRPGGFNANNSTPFGAGAFLLAGSEVYKLVGGKVPEVKTSVPASTPAAN